MANPPLFSIITITLNSEKYLAEAIESIIAQAYPNKEHIIIDGGSSDGTLEIIKSYKDRVRWISEPDAGISDAMNKGIDMARGDVISHLHSDDIYKGGTLEKVAEAFFNSPGKKWLVGNGEYVDEDGKKIRTTKINSYRYDKLKKHNFLFHPSIFIKKEIFSHVGYFNTDYKYAMDYDMWLRLGRDYEPILITGVLSSFRTHAGSLSTAAGVDALGEEYQIRKRNYGNESLSIKTFFYLRYMVARWAKKLGLM